MRTNRIDLVGKKFGRLTVKEYAGNDKWRAAMYSCECECGEIVTVRGEHLRSGHTTSCGCFQSEKTTTHGCKKYRLYSVWGTMISRCYNPSRSGYNGYGGRGITVCEDWKDVKNFIKWAYENGYHEGLSIDRIDNNGNYEPSNCRWATPKEQARNTRRSVKITLNGSTRTLPEWAEIYNIKPGTLYARFVKGDRGEKLFRAVGL